MSSRRSSAKAHGRGANASSSRLMRTTSIIAWRALSKLVGSTTRVARSKWNRRSDDPLHELLLFQRLQHSLHRQLGEMGRHTEAQNYSLQQRVHALFGPIAHGPGFQLELELGRYALLADVECAAVVRKMCG